MSGNDTRVWKAWGDKESPIKTIRKLRTEFGYSLALSKLIFDDNRPTTGAELVRAIRFGRIPVPTEEEAQRELKRRKNSQAAQKRQATLERKKAEAGAGAGKVVSINARRGREKISAPGGIDDKEA